MRINEVSPNTLHGSFSRDLIISKLWLIHRLKEIRNRFGTIYILGSWYGNLSLMIMHKNLRFDKIINVDVDQEALLGGRELADDLGLSGRIESMCKDANQLDYRQLGKDGLVINTSCNNIKGMDWFKNIPRGTMVALQGRDNDPGSINQLNDQKSFINAYPLAETLFSGEIQLDDPETAYRRYMLIGIR